MKSISITRGFPSVLHCLALWSVRGAAVSIAGAFAFAQLPLTRTPQPVNRDVEPPLPAGVSVESVTARPIDELLFDQPGDGALWARGTAYKARFDGAGATVVPFLGTDAPQDYPLALSVSGVTLGGTRLECVTDSAATRNGSCVSIDHGAFVEEYRLTKEALEQRFVFPELSGRGDLVLHMDVTSQLCASDLGATLRFENEFGRIDYGEAFAIDAAGERIALDSVLAGGAIELRVPECFVERATLPLTIDPFVTFFTVNHGSRPEFLSDVSYDATTDRWCVSWVEIWSSTDYDCYARVIDNTNTSVSLVTIDYTTDVWTDAKIANNNGANVFLVVAATIPPSGIADIRGRIIDAASATTGWQFNISPADGIYRNWPDVGGDPYPTAPSLFCVVWQASVGPFNADIEMQMVDTAGGLSGGVVPLENTPALHELPSISNSCGVDIGDTLNVWTVVWQQPYSQTDHDIYGAQVHWNGAIESPMFLIDYSAWDDTLPAVSSGLDSSYFGTARSYLIVYQRDYGDHDLIARAAAGTSLQPAVDLVGDFPSSTWYYDQTAPAVDSDGRKFLVEFEERTTLGAYDANVWMCDYFLTGVTLVPCELRKNFAGSVAAEFDSALHSKASSGGPSGRFVASWTFDTISNSYDVQGGVWDACIGGLVENICAGDGSGTACPCGNNGASGHGCANSVNPAGAVLTWSGLASVSADSFALHASGMPSAATCLFFQTTAVNGIGATFGDGLRCASGPPVRFPLVMSSSSAASYPSGGHPAISIVGQISNAGATRYYQAWYRDPAAYCTSATYNLSNALKVIWAP